MCMTITYMKLKAMYKGEKFVSPPFRMAVHRPKGAEAGHCGNKCGGVYRAQVRPDAFAVPEGVGKDR